MSVIQKIQEKYAKLMAIIIAIALIIFVVMLAFENGGSLFRGFNSTNVGSVNGKSIPYSEFSKLVQRYEDYYQSSPYGGGGAMAQQQAIESAWNYEVEQTLMKGELNKLGLAVGGKEMGDILYGANPPEFLKNAFTDSTGFYNGQMAKQRVDQLLKMKSGRPEELQTREQVVETINELESTRLSEKYRSLFTNSVNIPKWFIEKENADKSQMARVSFVREFYSAVNDTTIKITDKEIQDYINKNKDDFKQQASRSISYVSFSALPSASDSASARERIMAVKADLDSTKNIKALLAAQGVQTYYDSYINGSKIQIAVKDSIFRLPVGGVYGPYVDGGTFTLAKLMGVRTQPDTVDVRHILISTQQRDPQSGQMYEMRDSASARKLIDSIQGAIARGSNFDSLCAQLSEDQGSKANGGKYEKVQPGTMVPEFNDFIFGKPVGSKGVVQTEFGFHYIEILSAKGSSPAYKVAYISKPIETSSETESNAENEANKFAASSRDQKSFDASAEKLKAKGINKLIATDIAPMAFMIPGLGESRAFVKSIYKADLGDVLDPEKVGDNYVVAVVTEVIKEGTTPVARARFAVEPLLRNKKLAEKLTQKVGNPASLEAAAATLGGKGIEVADSLRMTGEQTTMVARGLMAEPKVLGASFNPANKGKITVVAGANALYVIRVDEVTATALADANVAEQRKARYQQAKMMSPVPTQALREAATIKDNRKDFY